MKIGILSVLMVLLLTACSGLVREQPARISCPEIFILKDTDRVARYLPDGNAPTIKNLLFEARSTFGDGECRMKDGTLSVTFKVGAYVKTTPLFDEEVSAPLNEKVEMFIGVRDKKGDILSRQAVGLQLFEEDDEDGEAKGTPLLRAFFKNKQEYDDLFSEDILKIASAVAVNIAVLPEDQASDYKIYLGFVITESELRNNRNGYLPSF